MTSIVTQQQIASHAGVSRAAVSKVLAGKAQEGRISPELADRILGVAKQLNYRPNAAARAMRNSRSMQIAIVLSGFDDRPFEDANTIPLMMGVNHRLVQSGYTAVLVSVNELDMHLSGQSRVFAEHAVDGVLVMNSVNHEAGQKISQHIRHCVYLDSGWWGEHNCIRRDECRIGYQAAEHLAQSGFDKLIWFGPHPAIRTHYSVGDRYHGVEDYAREHGLAFDRITCNSSRDFHQYDWRLRELAKQNVGIVIYDTRLFEALSYRMPLMGAQDKRPYGFACCDDKYGFEKTWPEICRPLVDRFAIGQQAADMLIEQLDQQEPIASRLIHSDWHLGTTAQCQMTAKTCRNEGV
jgi:LacI family transcriptional regulator